MCLWRIICVGLMGLRTGMCFLLDRYNIGNWQVWNLTLLFFILKVDGNEEDKVVWITAWSGSFEVWSFYSILSDRSNHPFPWKSIWKVKAPAKVSFFTWTVAKGRILTLDNLRKRNV